MAAACFMALAGGSALAAGEHGAHGGGERTSSQVGMQFASFSPVTVDVLAGDTVTWMNGSARTHTVGADDGSFESDRVVVGDSYSHTYATSGSFPYHCRLHPVMRGEVDAHTLLLDPQPESAAPGRSFPVAGRAALPEGMEVAIEGDAGSGYHEIARATVGTDGRFSAVVTPSASTSYRAVYEGERSPPVELLVLDRKVRARAARHGRAVVISATITPSAAGEVAVLQVRSRERFGWWPARRARLDHHSRARFVLHTPRRVVARVVLTRSDGATELARSAVARVPAAQTAPKVAHPHLLAAVATRWRTLRAWRR